MPPRTLASLAHALSAAPDLDAALVALGEALAGLERAAALALLRYDGRRELIRERMTPECSRVNRQALETSIDHLPGHVRVPVLAGGQFVELGDRSHDYARLFAFQPVADTGVLALRGVRVEGHLAAVLALFEPKKIFGARTTERLAPAVALFDLAFARLWEREAREEAVRTLEDVTQRVHADYVRKLAALEGQLSDARRAAAPDAEALAAHHHVERGGHLRAVDRVARGQAPDDVAQRIDGGHATLMEPISRSGSWACVATSEMSIARMRTRSTSSSANTPRCTRLVRLTTPTSSPW